MWPGHAPFFAMQALSAVLAEDPLTCDSNRLKDIRTERTFLGGRQIVS
jgi:predicted amidohydrolase YtcJ